MRSTKLCFDFAEMRMLAALAADFAEELQARGVLVDEEKRSEIVQQVVDIASQGFSDPDEIRVLFLERHKD